MENRVNDPNLNDEIDLPGAATSGEQGASDLSTSQSSLEPKVKRPSDTGRKEAQKFWDLKASHWITAALTLALIFVGVIQIVVYVNQSDTMSLQLSEMTHARNDTEAQQRAFLEVINPEMTPYNAGGNWIKRGELGAAGWHVSPGWKNVGLTLAQHARLGFDLKWYAKSGSQTASQLIENCPEEQPLDEYPDFAGFTIAPGDLNGKISPPQNLPREVAIAAQRNQMVIIFVVNATYQDAFQGSPVRHSFSCVDVVVNDVEKSEFSFATLKQVND